MTDTAANILEGIDETDLLPAGFMLEDLDSKSRAKQKLKIMNYRLIINDR